MGLLLLVIMPVKPLAEIAESRNRTEGGFHPSPHPPLDAKVRRGFFTYPRNIPPVLLSIEVKALSSPVPDSRRRGRTEEETMKDSEIIDLYWRRSEEAVSAAAEKYGGYCAAISRRILDCEEDAQECVNDTWLSAWNSIPPQRPENLAAYLGRLARNLSLNRAKALSAGKRGAGQRELALAELEECVPDPRGVEETVEEHELTQALNKFLYAQSLPRRNIFIRRYWYLVPVRELAAEYGMGERAMASLLFRMRKQLKRFLEQEGIL